MGPPTAAGAPPAGVRPRAWALITPALATVGAAFGVLGALDHGGGPWWVAAGLVLTWAAGAAVIRIRTGWLPQLMALVALAAGGAVFAAAQVEAGLDAWEPVRAVLLGLLPAVAVHFGFGAPDGSLPTTPVRVVVAAGYCVGGAVGLVAGTSADGTVAVGPYVVLSLAAGLVAVVGYLGRCRDASPTERARLQWIGWGVLVAGAAGGLLVPLDLLLDWPSRPGAVALAATAIVPLGLMASTVPGLLTVIDRVLVRTVVVVGLLALVESVYLFIVVGLGQVPEAEERSVLVLSMLAAGVCALLVFPARHRLEEMANQRVYGERHRPDDAVKTFAGRMSRAVPMDELLLQLAESLKKSLTLTASEVWTGSSGALDRAVSVPNRGPAHLSLQGEELAVAKRAHVQGNAWLQIWLPDLLEGRDDRQVRAAVVAHLGELLGLIVVERRGDDPPFTEDDDRVLVELARQVGLALHNVRLDSALQDSLEQLEERNQELTASRLRIVTAADESRRRIERNLHDGAQQHLVALAVKVGLIKQLIDADRAAADEMLDQLRGDVQDTLEELRELAHGIYPPLLRDRGLEAALKAAANRSTLPVELLVDPDVGRHPAEAEAAVYFCCLEAMQNAGKYAGDEAQLTVTITETGDELRFEVADDGPGFDADEMVMGHGFVNMRDRLGAIDGVLDVDSGPGLGARVRGFVPVEPGDTDENDQEGQPVDPVAIPAP